MSKGVVVDMLARPMVLPRNHDSLFVEVDPIPAPLAEELLEVLPDVRINKFIGTDYKVQYSVSVVFGMHHESATNHVLAEALALLLIELVEQRVVSKESLSS